ncbi:hypothetical protein GCM10009584_05960 [Ornithinimicrobium humiphilum]|uniref:Cell wall-associated NlpC family hydrolase n=1 Tax=Ornithinimicrobium humiphilum TaxID=125288 RepID=A0A543KPW2_9MICO|nr:C40 family peptidase [Ornithinimicrobium humiphilum]TQM97110.1 cell wall-associated NlpC family hydrolase [Ornithinimicrobium humiphilum]
MKSTTHRAKHRSGGSAAPRNGAAALMIGGLVAGTVATAGATTLTTKADQPSSGLAANLSSTLDPGTDESAAEETTAETPAPEAAVLRSESLAELRDQGAADRSQARSAPEDAASVTTLLQDSGFTGTTIEVEVPVEQVEQAAAEPAQQEQVQAAAQSQTQTQTQTQAQPAQQQQAAATQTQQATPAPAPVGGSVLGVAASYVGYPYQLMGTPPSSFDCSAFTWWVFQQAGISIPRSVAGQRGAVTPVSNPQPGDLIFYNDWHHVGIYAGNGMTYEALNPGTGVRYGPLLSSNVWYGRIG